MSSFAAQISRIRIKLAEAKAADAGHQVFGAFSHQYSLGPPATRSEVGVFEEKYSIQLPPCYRTFITEVGNGGPSFAGSSAGPFYGIYPLGHDPGELLFRNPEKYLRQQCVLHPRMSDEEWKSLTAAVDGEEELPDEVYEEAIGKMFGGILPLGSQGCTYVHGIVLNGPYLGRMVNLDMDRQKPSFCFEANFLDWYERWLDEVISGQLITSEANWFGFVKGGSEEELLNEFYQSADATDKLDCLVGLQAKRTLNSTTLDSIEKGIATEPGFDAKLTMLLCKFDYNRAKPHLLRLVQTDLRTVVQSINWYARKSSGEWVQPIADHLNGITDAETFNFCTYVLMDSGADYGAMIAPFVTSASQEIRAQAFYALGKLNNKEEHLSAFLTGLGDPSMDVLVMVLRMMEGVKDERLLPAYQRLAEQYADKNPRLAPHLDRCLAAWGLNSNTVRA